MWSFASALVGFASGACVVLLLFAKPWAQLRRNEMNPKLAGQSELKSKMTRMIAESGVHACFIEGTDDAATLAQLDRRLRTDPLVRLIAPIRDRTLRRSALRRLHVMDPRPNVLLFSVAERMASHLVGAARLYDQAYWRDHARLHAVIIGFTALGRACMEEAIFAGIAGELAPPRITILDAAPRAIQTRLDAEMPEIGRSIELEVLAYDAKTVNESGRGPWNEIQKRAPITAIFVCLDDDESRLRVTAALQRLQQTVDPTLGPVFAMSESGSASGFLFDDGDADDLVGRVVSTDGLTDQQLRSLLDRDLDDGVARRLHDAYRLDASTKGVAAVAWSKLGESYRDANRHAAEHIAQKLWTAGLLWPAASGDMARVRNEAYASIIEPCAHGSGEDHLMRRLARLEHDRWCAERRLDGWIFGPRRDEDHLTHPSLTSFDDPRFPDGEIRKDIDQIRYVFGKVVTADDQGAAPPIVIGVDTRDDMKGVGLAAAWALADAARWRPVFVVSGLQSDDERRVVDALMERLSEAGRSTRLLVVSQSKGLSRPRGAVFILVGSPDDKDEDHWCDPSSEEADSAFDLSAYLAQRAHAIVCRP